ncbi:helix-turn-helix domain-containing protein [Azorhizobium doebereinerae]|uniref:helix-turn-helix domain-containing protein n=1 Tax=Azorhizobium doebereinerae TaxID=281091 RepID=UPI001AEBA7FA
MGVTSAREMSVRLGLGPNTWRQLEDGRNLPSSETLQKLLDLGFNANWVLSGQGPIRLDGADERSSNANPAQPPLNARVLAQALALVEEWLTANKRMMRADKKAAVVAQIYEFALEDASLGKEPIDSHRVAQFLRLVA